MQKEGDISMNGYQANGKTVLAAGLAGAAIGAVGLAAAYAMTNKQTREKINQKIDVAQDKGKQKLASMKEAMNEKKQKVASSEEVIK